MNIFHVCIYKILNKQTNKRTGLHLPQMANHFVL